MEVQISSYGGIIVAVRTPDRTGNIANIVQGFAKLESYLTDAGCYGALVGRFANRIAGAKIVLNGATYALVTTDGATVQIHGGPKGYSKRVWDAVPIGGRRPSLVLSLVDPDGEMGFPGRVEVKVIYTLTCDNVLRIRYFAETNKDTVINLTNHSYFCLDGLGTGTVDDEELFVSSDEFLPTDSMGMPLGEIRPVKGTPFDFTTSARLGDRFSVKDEQIIDQKGINHTFVVRGRAGRLRLATRLLNAHNGRTLEVWTTQPGVQIYTANFVSPHTAKKRHYQPHGAIAFETQHYPNSPNQANFPSTVISPGRPLHEITEFRFGVC